ncbi:MAG: hypothetical protein AAF721_09195 [Myxococcota bacterium]
MARLVVVMAAGLSVLAGAGVVTRAVAAPTGPQSAAFSLTVHDVAVPRGEDGRGATVPATRPQALDVRGPSIPVRALDPVLHIGPLHFHHYTFPAKGVLRYVVADGKALPPGAEVYLQWGDDERSRIVIRPGSKGGT